MYLATMHVCDVLYICIVCIWLIGFCTSVCVQVCILHLLFSGTFSEQQRICKNLEELEAWMVGIDQMCHEEPQRMFEAKTNPPSIVEVCPFKGHFCLKI